MELRALMIPEVPDALGLHGASEVTFVFKIPYN